MALERIGLGGILKFDEKQAVAGMRRAGKASDRFRGSFNKIVSAARAVGQAMGQAAQSMRGLGVAALPATAALAFGVKQAADFEQQMSAVAAITGATAEDMARLEQKAKTMGATTAFSATEAAQGMEFLSRAGFDVDEQIAALGPTLNAAAADGIDLATSANIVANTLKGMGLPATDAARAADVLALTSSKANTDMIGLGEAMKFAAPQSKTLGISLETTAAILGSVADAGLKGTIGGTSFTQAMVKLVKPTSAGAKALDDFGITMTKTADGGLDIVDVFRQINTALKSETDVVKRARLQTEIFGLRGQKAFAAVGTALDTGKLDALVEATNNAAGAAERMAKIRLDNLTGAFTLLKSAAEGFALETAGLFLGPLTDGVQGYTESLSDVVLVLQELNSETGLTEETADSAGATIVAVAKGIKEGIDTVIDAWGTFRTNVTDFITEFTGAQGPEVLQSFTRIATILFLVAGLIAPILIAIGSLAFFVSSVLVPGFTAIGTAIGLAFGGPVLIAVGALGAAFFLIRQEGESIGQTFTRVKNGIISGFNFVVQTAVMPLVDSFMSVATVTMPFIQEHIMGSLLRIKGAFQGVFSGVMQVMQALAPVTSAVFSFIGKFIGFVATGIGLVFVGVFDGIASLVTNWKNIILSVLEAMVNAIKGAAELLGKAASFVGLDFGQQLQDFGKGEFKIRTTSGPRQTAETEANRIAAEQGKNIPADLTGVLAEMSAQTISDQPIFTPGDLDSIGFAVGDAMAANQPKDMTVEAKLCVDGKTVAKATAKHKQEINDRAGFKATPWQRRALAEHGATNIGST